MRSKVQVFETQNQCLEGVEGEMESGAQKCEPVAVSYVFGLLRVGTSR
jgi:hypothetical protein